MEVSKNTAQGKSIQVNGWLGDSGFVVAEKTKITENKADGSAIQLNTSVNKMTFKGIAEKAEASKKYA